MFIQGKNFQIRPIRQDEKGAVLTVYQQCEDFLALTPLPIASMEIVEADLALSRENGGIFCGIYNPGGTMMGIVDVVVAGFEGDPGAAFIELIMIGHPYRSGGLGSAVVEAVEAEILCNPAIKAILIGVMVNNPAALRFWERHGYSIMSGPTLEDDGTTVWRLGKDMKGDS
jgi:ribosomal protein S18 acetylase RimI-like enzyme